MRQARRVTTETPRSSRSRDAPHGGGAQEQCFLTPAQMENAVAKNVAAFEITGQLHLIDGDESRIGFARHRFDGADRIFRACRRDFFFARNERHLVGADLLANPRVDLARQQP